jgi:hypothetical protein
MPAKYQPNDANQYAKIAHGTEVVEPEYDPQGNCPSLRSRPAKWLRFEDTAIAVKQLLHDATRRYTWDADIHLTSVTTEGRREPQRIEEKKK